MCYKEGGMVECQDEVPGRHAKENGCLPEGGALLSVIVPVYNVEAYLRRCLDSLCSQSYSHLEIICVDDGSTDGSLAILREYEAKDSRIRVVSKPNGGVSSARNAALEVATGEWLASVDPDDYLLPDAYSIAMARATDEVDMVVFRAHVEAEGGAGLEKNEQKMCAWANSTFEGLKTLNARCFPSGGWYLWNRLFRRSIIERHGLRFDNSICLAEDLCFFMRYCAYAKKAYFCPEELYVYILRGGSIVNTRSNPEQRSESYVRALDNILTVYEEQGLVEAYAPFFKWSIWNEDININKWAYVAGDALERRERLVQMLRRHHLQQYSHLEPLLRDLEEQLRHARRGVELLRASVENVSAFSGDGQAFHVAIPTDELHAGQAALLVLGLQQTAASCGLVYAHIICDDISSCTRKQLLSLNAEGVTVCIHELDAQQLHHLPVLRGAFPYSAYLKMAIPWLLPDAERVLVLSPGLLLDGALPSLHEVDMAGMPVAVMPDLPVADRETSANRLRVEHYVSSTVMLMDIGLMHDLNRVETWMASYLFIGRCYAAAEGDSFNRAFNMRMVDMPPEWGDIVRPASVPELVYAACVQGASMPALPVDVGRTRTWVQPTPAAKPTVAPESKAVGVLQNEMHLASLAPQYGRLRRRYYYYKCMSRITWGRRRRRYKEKRRFYGNVLRQIRQFFNDSRKHWGV